MANLNFTQFTAGSIISTSYLVGYDSSANTQYRYSSASLLTFVNANLPIATSSVAGIVQIGSGLTITGNLLSANVQSVAGRQGSVTLSVTDVTGAAQSGANSNITSLTGLTARPTWSLSSVVTTPWDNGNLPVIGGRLLSFQIVTSSTTVSVPANCAYIIGEGVGPGGGSGGSAGAGSGQSAVSQSGGSGTYCKFQITSPPSTLTVTIGAPGSAGAATAAGNGGAGGSTTIVNSSTTYVTIPGGAGGLAATVTTYASPYVIPQILTLSTLATGSASFIENQSGSLVAPSLVVGTTAAVTYSAPGGSSRWGAGAPAAGGVSSSSGVSATQYGAGASGCAIAASGASNTGGSGGPSKVVLYFYANQ